MAPMDFVILVAGIAGLWIGTEFTVGGALAIAKRHQLSEFFVGLVILSIGSDLPELAIAIDAGLKGLMGHDASGVVIGSSIGSVIAQIGFVLGLAGVISHLALPRAFVLKHGAVLLGATVLLFLLALDGQVTRIEGLVLISAYVIYVLSLMNREKFPDEKPGQLAGGGFRSWSLLIVGLGAVTLSSEITVTAVVNIAYTFELSEALISVLIIGLGTSLPELSISISAIMKKKAQLSVGNIVGSNILDTLLPIGIAAVISEMTFERQLLYFDLPFIFVLTTVVLALLLRKQGVARTQGLIILGFYFSYVFVKLMQF
jgi:cation:H+ antiporter